MNELMKWLQEQINEAERCVSEAQAAGSQHAITVERTRAATMQGVLNHMRTKA